MGNLEKITVITRRSSTVVSRIVINRNPGFFEIIFLAWYERAWFLIHPTEEKFRERVKRSIDISLKIAHDLDEGDKEQELKIIRDHQIESQMNMDTDMFLESLVESKH
jgi:hypothetical protein